VIREAQGVVLLLLGNAVLRITLGGQYRNYVKPGLYPYLLVAGAALVVLGVGALADALLRRPRRAVVHDDAAGCPHPGGAAGAPRVAWLLTLPVFVVFVVAPPPLGSFAASRDSGRVSPPASTDYPALPPGDPARIPLTDYAVRAVWDAGRTLTGRTVALTGFVTPRGGGGWYLTRMTLVCCAADARATKIEVRGAGAPAADTWVTVLGAYAPSTKSDPDTAVPAMEAATVTEIAAPAEAYE
jgi:uncharacterized repeat protein (TIGR03943 family)